VQCHERVLQLGQLVRLAAADPAADQFGDRAGQPEVGLVGNGRPIGVADPRALVPLGGHLGVMVPAHLDPLDRPRPAGRHVHVEHPGKRRLVGEEAEERPAPRAQRVLVRGSRRDRAGGGVDPVGHELPALVRRGEEARLLVGEVRVERRAGHPRPAHDVGDRDGGVPGFGDGGDDRPAQPLLLRCTDIRFRKAVAPPRQTRLALVSVRERPRLGWVIYLLHGVGHAFRVTRKSLKYIDVL